MKGRFMRWLAGAVVAILLFSAPSAFATAPAGMLVYVGTYTDTQSKGIYAFRLNPASGVLVPLGLVAECANPSFLALHPNHRSLYAVGETAEFESQKTGSVSAFAIDGRSGKLRLLNRRPSGGSGPCHLAVDGTGRCVLVANYGAGSVATLPIRTDGSLDEPATVIQHHGSSANPQRQEAPHAHWIGADPDNRFVAAADLGLDKVLVYRLDPGRAKLSPDDPPGVSVKPGAGPRHFAFHPSGRFAYVINELNCTLTAFAYDGKRGELKELETVSTLPGAFREGYSTAELEFHPTGKFLYGSNRGHDSIVVFAVDPDTGKLTRLQNEPSGGRTPRSFGIDPTGTFLLATNEHSDNVVVFRIDPNTGRLEKTQSVQTPKPVCVKFLAPGP